MPNRLANATSPYLLQHAHNPVDWHEWGEEALALAKREDRPILLSVGYAACHWCHVMERESFEDEATAALMNESFVNVKVDREERPDVDAIYMDAVQAMTGRGGWPMTVFLTPAGEPFFAGTYFPPEDRHGLPGFRRVLESAARAWRQDRERLLAQGAKVIEAIAATPGTGEDLPEEEVLAGATGSLRHAFDREHGGFGGAPKFPQPMTIEFLLRMHPRGESGALEMATTTLDHMAAGGIHDQIGGGFHRYSTDERWLVPHFEKMLYDNALLARAYLHAYQLTERTRYREVCSGTLDHLLRDLRHPQGGFFSSQDADSEGEEGRFYVWSWEELLEVAGEEAARRFGGAPEGNWEGRNILTMPEIEGGLAEARSRLFEAREPRVKPATDDKVLTAWNGLAIRALAETGRVLGESRYVDAAVAAADFVLSALRRDDGRLLRAWREGRTSGPGYLDDHACMAAACLTLYETTFDLRWFEEARGLADDLLRLFRDPDGAGFFQTGSDAEALVIRPKELFDNAVPSGSSVAAELLQRLALFTGEASYEEAAVSALRAVGSLLPRAPSMFGHALGALDLHLGPAREVAIVGEREEREPLVRAVWSRYLPNTVLAAMEPGDERSSSTIPLLEGKGPVDGKAAAYVCERFACKEPVTEPGALAAQLAQPSLRLI